MTLLLKDGDYALEPDGTLTSLSGNQEVLQRVLIKLTARRGGFPLLPELGSQLYQLLRSAPAQRETLAKQYIREALADEPELSLSALTLTPQAGNRLALSVSLDYRGEALTANLTLTEV